MKKIALSLILISTSLTLIKCGKAAEDRFQMHETAKRVSDSIGKTIDDAMAEVAITNTNAPAPVVADTTKK